MEIRCLFAQRKCSYEGQYAPELLAAIDGYGDEDNPEYLNDEQKKAEKNNDLLFTKRITISIPKERFDAVFFGENRLEGVVKSS